MPIPDVVIVGAQRCGTSSLYRWLEAHPEIVTQSLNEESMQFSYRYDRPLDEYRSSFKGYGPGKLSLEKSADYLNLSFVPERIRDANPDAKIIILIRDPVDRAYSHYWHERNNGFEFLEFKDAIDRRIFSGYDAFHFNYVGTGQYVDHIALWNQYFRKQILIVRSDLMFKHPEIVYLDVQYWLRLKEIIALDRYWVVNKQEYEPIDFKTKRKLQEYFKPYDEALKRFLEPGKDAGHKKIDRSGRPGLFAL